MRETREQHAREGNNVPRSNFRNHWRTAENRWSAADSFGATIFVADLTEDMDEVWLKLIFSGAGKIIEVHIPRRRSFHLNQKFGFVKFGSRDEGVKAIKMWNTAQIQGHQLLVKFAKFGNERWSNQRRKSEVKMIYRAVEKRNSYLKDDAAGGQPNSNIGSVGKSKMHAKVLSPLTDSGSFKGGGKQVSIKVSEIGNGWLYRSAIAKLSPLRSIIYMQDHLSNLGYAGIKIRPIDSDNVVLTFDSVQDRDSIFGGGKFEWLKGCFSEIQKWEDTITSQRSRLVWLNCYGIPLHVWNASTFKSIGQIWGDVVKISEESYNCLSFTVGKVLISTVHMDLINQMVTLLNNDRSYSVRVSEEQFVINTFPRSVCNCKCCPAAEIQSLHQDSREDGKLDEPGKLAASGIGMEGERSEEALVQIRGVNVQDQMGLVVEEMVESSSLGAGISIGEYEKLKFKGKDTVASIQSGLGGVYVEDTQESWVANTAEIDTAVPITMQNVNKKAVLTQ